MQGSGSTGPAFCHVPSRRNLITWQNVIITRCSASKRAPTADEIKKGYRTKAKELHPDRNSDNPKAEAQFKEANEAYDVLKNPDKKAAYDRYGHAAFEGGMGGGGGVPDGGFGGQGRLWQAHFRTYLTTCSATSWAANAAAAADAVPRAALTCAITCASRSKTPLRACKKPSTCQHPSSL